MIKRNDKLEVLIQNNNSIAYLYYIDSSGISSRLYLSNCTNVYLLPEENGSYCMHQIDNIINVVDKNSIYAYNGSKMYEICASG